MAKDELWHGQQAEKMRSQFFSAMGRGKKPNLFNNEDQDYFSQLKNKDLKLGVKPSPRSEQVRELPDIKNKNSNELSVDARMQKAAEDIEQRITDTLGDEELSSTPEQDYVTRLVAFDRQMGFMPEKPRSQVEKLANAITREFNLNGQESTGATTGITVNPEVLLTNTTKDLLKTFTPENFLVLAPLTLALMVVRAMPPEVKATLKRWYEKMPVNTRRVLVLMMATVILAGCSAMTGTPTKEADPGNNNDPVAGETAGAPSEEAATEEAATEEAATEEPLSEEEQQYQDIAVSIQEDPFYNTAYVQAREATNNGEIPEACVAMIKDLVARQEIASAETLEEWGINSNGDCYIRWTEKGITTIVFDNKDTNGYLYVRYNPSEHPEGSVFEYKDTESGFWATVSIDGKVVRAVDGRTSQWVNVIDGQMMDANGQPTPIPTMTPINADPNETRPAIKMIDPEAIAKLVADYKNGDLKSLSSLNLEQQAAFSQQFVEKMREERGSNVVYFTYKGEKYFINPKTLEAEIAPSNPDDKFLSENTLEIYWPVSLNTEGKLLVDVNGEKVTIDNSVNIDWNMVITDPHDQRIDWPKVDKLGFGDFPDLTLMQFYLQKKDDPGKAASIVPVVILDKNIGEIILESGPAFRKDSFLKIGTVETDAEGNPLFLRISLMFDGGTAILQEEGSGSEILAAPRIREGYSFLEALDENTVYYLGFPINQSVALSETTFASTGNLDGFAPIDQSSKILTNNQVKQNKIALIFAHTLIKRAN